MRCSAGMSNQVRVSVCVPHTFLHRSIDPVQIRRYLARVDELGCFEGVWDQESALGQMPSLSPLELLTFTAACTQRLRMGCAVLVTTLRSPVHLAKSLASIDHLSGGRLDVGVGLGGNLGSYPAFGATPEGRVTRFVETIRIMKSLWTEPRTTFEGRFWQLKDAAMEPKPMQKPHPPLWFGGNHPDAVRRAVRYGTGFIGAGSSSPEGFARSVAVVRQTLDEAKRDPATFDLAKRVYIAVDRNKDRAWQRLSEWFNVVYGRTNYEDIALWGSPEECVDGLRKLVDMGAKLVVPTPLFDEAEQLEVIASEVVPHLAA